MKKILFIFFLIVQNIGAYNTVDYNNLISGGKDLVGADLTDASIEELNLESVNFSNADLSGSFFKNCSLNNADFNNSNLSNSKLIDCNFAAKNISEISNAENLILLRVIIDDTNTNVLRDKGAFIPNKSIICNSDLHAFENDVQEEDKIKQIPRMIEAANNSKNNVKAIVIAGDLCQMGDQKDWDKFTNVFYDPLKNTGKPVLLTVGNHDRWQREDTLAEKLNVWSRTAVGLGSVAVEKIKDLYDGNIYYKKYVSDGMDIISLGECPTMTNKYNDGTISWYKNLSHKYPEIIFYHYCPIHPKDWWTTGDNPRPTNLSRGEEALESFNDSLIPYKDRISLMITGHYHSTFFKYWKGIPVVNVAGRDRFALCHFYTNKDLKINKCVAIEMIHYDSSKESVFNYPCLEDQEVREVRTAILTHIYRTCFHRNPDSNGLLYYLDNWYKHREENGIKADIENSPEGRPISLRNIYLTYLEREPDSGGFNNYLENWELFGYYDGIVSRIKNSTEYKSLIIRKLYIKWLEREADAGGLNNYVSIWDSIGGEVEIKNRLRNSEEGRPISLRNMYLTYLEREPDVTGLNHYLENWEELGYYDGIVPRIKNSTEYKSLTVRKLYLECLERDVNRFESDYYVAIWDSIGGEVEIENRLRNLPEGRPVSLRNLYLTYLEREPDVSGFNHYLEYWDELGSFSGIEARISNSVESKKIQIKNRFQEYLDRDATINERDYYLEVWDYIGGEQGVEKELQTYYSN